MKYIDIHCHLDSKDFDNDRDAVLARMKEEGVGAITVGASLEESKKAVEIAEANENVWATIGVHPEYSTSPLTPLLELGEGKHISHSDNSNASLPSPASRGRVGDEVKEFSELIKSPKVVAIGECGLDYFKLDPASATPFAQGYGGSKKATADKQKKLFESQIQFAIKYDKPLMLHVRSSEKSQDAYNDALEILENYKKEAGDKLRGDVHFFAGDINVAKKFLDLGFTFSFTGVITFTHDPARNASLSSASVAGGYDEVVKYIPENSIMSETDAPWVAPAPFRGQRNEPTYVIEVVKKMAEIRGENFEDLNAKIIENAKRVFNLRF